MGARFHRAHLPHTAQSLPFSASKASVRPMGKLSSASLAPMSAEQ
jgi:hypothetical protein